MELLLLLLPPLLLISRFWEVVVAGKDDDDFLSLSLLLKKDFCIFCTTHALTRVTIDPTTNPVTAAVLGFPVMVAMVIE